MESVHGVDVSWLHRPHKEHFLRSRAPSSPAAPQTDYNAPLPQTPQIETPSRSDSGASESLTPLSRTNTEPIPSKSSTQGPPLGTIVTNIEGNAPRSQPRRPNLLSRSSSEKLAGDGKSPRRGSWISNVSSRFSSGKGASPGSPATPQLSKPAVNGTHGPNAQPDFEKVASPVAASPRVGSRSEDEELQPYVPQKPKESSGSFFSSLTRKLSNNAQGSPGIRQYPENGGVCPRRTLNVNPNRSRCLVPELDQSKLRRVSFSVDVEIAGGPKYKDDEPVTEKTEKTKKTKDKKIKERAEGEALKNPQSASQAKDEEDGKEMSLEEALAHHHPEEAQADDSKDSKTMTRKQEKKKRSEEERKERKEKKRKKAEENGTLPIELSRNDSQDSSPSNSIDEGAPPAPPKSHDKPTTDPVRIYRRCCQLRESPILKRITEQLMNPNCTVPNDPGTVNCLNLTGSRLQLADFVTLGDWLAIVPVRRVLLEDADITDEGLRVVLAGLLSAKQPGPTRAGKRNSVQSSPSTAGPERSGVVEKLVLKNNPRITRIGWKHLALFLNMCKSIKAIDLSMLQFPDNLPPGVSLNQLRSPTMSPPLGSLPDAAEIFSKALAERQGGAKLEELIMSECNLNAAQIRKIVDGAEMCGIGRLGLAGTDLDDAGFEHILRYVRSGVCTALDIGSNDLNGKLHKLADALAFHKDCPVWGLSLASCNLDTESLRPLFPILAKLSNLRFLDLSHNTALFEDNATDGVHLLRKYIPLFVNLKRIHLNDVGLSAAQAIALAEILPEGPSLAHFSILENAELTKLVLNTDEASQEEACALYASLMAAVRVSSTLVCIDIDVPPANNSEVVKALAKQVIAYCLRNMETMPLNETTASALKDLSSPTGSTGKPASEITVPDVLIHLVGHVDGFSENHDGDDPAPDDDYIVGGTGVVKALQYCLGEKAQELRRGSNPIPGTASSPGWSTPKTQAADAPESSEKAAARRGKAKEMSKNLLGSARKIRARLQPALIKEAQSGDEMAYRRLLFLDKTLEGMIRRFEDEYPECRVAPASPQIPANLSSSVDSAADTSSFPGILHLGNPAAVDPTSATSAVSDDEDDELRLRRPSRRGSEVSLASKALGLEEGRMHRLGHGIRQDILDSAGPSTGGTVSPGISSRASSAVRDADDESKRESTETRGTSIDAGSAMGAVSSTTGEKIVEQGVNAHLDELRRKLEDLSGEEMRELVDRRDGWEGVLEKVGANVEELRMMQQSDPEGWEAFTQSQLAARKNRG